MAEINNDIQKNKDQAAVKENPAFSSYQNFNDFESYMDNEDEDFNEHQKGYKLYNFRRPDKFSKEHLRGLQDIHREFSRQLSLSMTGYLRIPINVDVVSVDQITYDEFVASMPTPMTVGIFELDPLLGQILIGFSFEVISSIVDRMLGGIGTVEIQSRELTDVEEALTKKVLEKTINTFADSWSNIMPAVATLIDVENSFSLVQVASPGEIIALITLEVQISGQYYGLMNICLPYPLLESIIGQLSTQHIFQTKGIMATAEEKQNMIDKLNTSNVDIEVLFGKTKISLKDFMALKEGDVVLLENKIQDDLVVKVNGAKKFFARPGTMKNKLCVKVEERYNETSDILKSYL
ncbi:MAG: flagellar motor switch protein FliM [Candidatus Gastranaerophilales bacterium]|nr:flagellar motor switch protein FliM [Candidatus Gastranaerophilales bacterium]